MTQHDHLDLLKNVGLGVFLLTAGCLFLVGGVAVLDGLAILLGLK